MLEMEVVANRVPDGATAMDEGDEASWATCFSRCKADLECKSVSHTPSPSGGDGVYCKLYNSVHDPNMLRTVTDGEHYTLPLADDDDIFT